MADDVKVEMVCGGVYEYVDAAKTVSQGLMVSMKTDANGFKTGVIHWTGYKPELIHSDNLERWAQLKLVGRPAPAVVAKPKPPATRAKTPVGRPKKKS